jgi:hypothetical protein
LSAPQLAHHLRIIGDELVRHPVPTPVSDSVRAVTGANPGPWYRRILGSTIPAPELAHRDTQYR